VSLIFAPFSPSLTLGIFTLTISNKTGSISIDGTDVNLAFPLTPVLAVRYFDVALTACPRRLLIRCNGLNITYCLRSEDCNRSPHRHSIYVIWFTDRAICFLLCMRELFFLCSVIRHYIPQTWHLGKSDRYPSAILGATNDRPDLYLCKLGVFKALDGSAVTESSTNSEILRKMRRQQSLRSCSSSRASSLHMPEVRYSRYWFHSSPMTLPQEKHRTGMIMSLTSNMRSWARNTFKSKPPEDVDETSSLHFIYSFVQTAFYIYPGCKIEKMTDDGKWQMQMI